jgi:hypothetical protein
MEHGDFYELFRRFWWLIFPLCGMAMGLLHMNQRHDRNNRILDMIRVYAEQGKEPPPELLKLLNDQGEQMGHSGPWMPVFLFGALAAGFALGAVMRMGQDHSALPFLFIAIVMAGLCLGSLFHVLRNDKRERKQLP